MSYSKKALLEELELCRNALYGDGAWGANKGHQIKSFKAWEQWILNKLNTQYGYKENNQKK